MAALLGNNSASEVEDDPEEAAEFERGIEVFEPEALTKAELCLSGKTEVKASSSSFKQEQETSVQPPGTAAQQELLARIIALQERGISTRGSVQR
ncbi:MAG: hypothetical protein E5Y88_28990 [Mesorhizobium sp.]|uniref:hypothetical protein n=1 Tax=Mesorhizobium sp. TaxID=1871066 RepID=UPI00120B2091|nr:hypothetical protein [Mesorhizobium sp.]TIL22195.1 MAG: hypothetical protein E5Y88_28990 [Mesorhizobium sp.]